jgi:hypothetical protein
VVVVVVVVVVVPGVDCCCCGIESGANCTEVRREVLPLPLPLPGPETVVKVEYGNVGDLLSPSPPVVVVAVVVAAGVPA